MNRSGRSVKYHFKAGLTHEQKKVGLLQHVMPLALSLSGELILHCACVVWRDSAFLIVGDAGVGKSTLAHYLYKNGFTIFSDDAALVKKKAKHFLAFPSVPMMRVLNHRTKKITYIDNQPQKPPVIRGIYFPLIKSMQKRAYLLRIGALPGMENLLSQVFRLALDVETLNAREFNKVASLCRHVPLYEINYAHTAMDLKKFKNLLVSHAKSKI